MALVYGEPGLGKSQTALWLACKYDAIYLRAANLISVRWHGRNPELLKLKQLQHYRP